MKPKELAAAGFFHTKRQGDSVTCYVCSAGLRDWDEFDDPWHIHARFFGECEFVRLMKGREYIKSARENAQARAHPNVSIPSNACNESTQIDENIVENKFTCVICCENPIESVLLPCKHVHTCMRCALNLDSCSVCRSTILKIERIYLP